MCRDRADQFCELSASYGTKPGQAPLPPWGTLALQPGPRFQHIGDGDGGESPIPDKAGTGAGERPRPRANRGRTPRPRPRTNRGRGRGRGPAGCPRPAGDRATEDGDSTEHPEKSGRGAGAPAWPESWAAAPLPRRRCEGADARDVERAARKNHMRIRIIRCAAGAAGARRA